MESHSLLCRSSKMDTNDLSQEGYSYMKIKQFLADRLSQQQEEIDALRRKVKYYIARDVVNQDLIAKLSRQVLFFKKKEGDLSFSSEAFSRELEGDVSKENKKEEAKGDDEELNEEDLRDEVNKLTVDKFILFNELNELVMGLKRCKLDKLNELLLKSKEFSIEEVPIVNGLQLNVLSADSQLSQIAKTDYKRNANGISKEQIEYYDSLVKECEKEFTMFLEKKLKILKQ